MDRSFANSIGRRVVAGLIWAGVLVFFLGLVLGIAAALACSARGASPDLQSYKVATPFVDPFRDIQGHCMKWDNTWPDLITLAHENTHQINSELRNRVGVENAFYVLNDRCFLTNDPATVTLADVENQLRHTTSYDERSPLFKLYVVDAQRPPRGAPANCVGWNDTPTYLVDEAVAYTNGAIAGLYHNHADWQDSAKKATTLTFFSLTACDVIEHKEPTFNVKRLRAFILWNSRRIPKPIYPMPAPREPMPIRWK